MQRTLLLYRIFLSFYFEIVLTSNKSICDRNACINIILFIIRDLLLLAEFSGSISILSAGKKISRIKEYTPGMKKIG